MVFAINVYVCHACSGSAMVGGRNKRGDRILVCSTCGASRPAPRLVRHSEPPRGRDGLVPWAR